MRLRKDEFSHKTIGRKVGKRTQCTSGRSSRVNADYPKMKRFRM